MAPLLTIAELAVAAGVVFFAIRTLGRRGVAAGWWLVLAIAALAGGIAGAWFGFHFSYQPSPGVVVYSFPLPAHFQVFETYDNGAQQWVNFGTPAPLLVAVANACFLLSVPVALVWLANCLASRFHRPPNVGAATY